MRWALPLFPPFLLLAGCSQPAAIAPGKIVSNNPCIDAILAEIADPEQIGAVSAWSHSAQSGSAPLDWARRFPSVGTSAEEVIAAKPALVLTGNLAGSGTNLALTLAGLKVETIGVPATLAESRAQIVQIANAIGRQRQGQFLLAKIDAATEPASPRQSAIIWLASGFVPGMGTIQDELLARAGFENASARYGLKQWDVLPLETLIRNPPDLIFSPDMADGEDGRALAMRHQVLQRLEGRTKIVRFPEKLLLCAGPNIVETMRVLHSASPSLPREGMGVGESQDHDSRSSHPPQPLPWKGGALQ